MFQKKIAYFKYILQLQVFIKKSNLLFIGNRLDHFALVSPGKKVQLFFVYRKYSN